MTRQLNKTPASLRHLETILYIRTKFQEHLGWLRSSYLIMACLVLVPYSRSPHVIDNYNHRDLAAIILRLDELISDSDYEQNKHDS